MAARNGKYYLICNYDKYSDVSNYRVDRIADVRVLDEPTKPFGTLEGAERDRLDLAKYMAEHVFMYSGGNTQASFRIAKSMVGDVIELFGTDVRFSDETEEHVTATAYVNEQSMLHFAKVYAPDVVILSPQRLADQILTEAEKTLENYRKAGE